MTSRKFKLTEKTDAILRLVLFVGLLLLINIVFNGKEDQNNRTTYKSEVKSGFGTDFQFQKNEK